MPNPLLTEDQLRLLKYDNILSGKYKSNFDIGLPSKRFFDVEVKKYCHMWRDGGLFSTEKYIEGGLENEGFVAYGYDCLLYTSPSPRDRG